MDLRGFKMLRDLLLPTQALVRLELRTLFRSWLVRLWLAAAIVLSFLTVLTGWSFLTQPVMLASLVFPFLVFPWFVVVIILGTSAVSSGQLEAAADGILSRPITRLEYLGAAWLARAIAVLLVFVVAVIPAALITGLADRPVKADPVTTYGAVVGLGIVVLVLLGILSLGFLMGVLLRNAWVALLVVLFVWYPINGVLTTFRLAEFSPISLNQALPTVFRKSWSTPAASDQVNPLDVAILQQQADEFLRVFSGPPQRPERRPEFFRHDLEYKDIRPGRVALSYTLPVLLFFGLSYLCFWYRDL
ncbi:hypothetical protein [Thermogutta sp.]|uniref:hypothetical protein n=1 Tax=Thermogutta sp. TaxID=1962930 RepID=UPI0032209E1F